jgi:hypothetical protein
MRLRFKKTSFTRLGIVASAFALLAVGGVWVRSYFASDMFDADMPHSSIRVVSSRGQLLGLVVTGFSVRGRVDFFLNHSPPDVLEGPADSFGPTSMWWRIPGKSDGWAIIELAHGAWQNPFTKFRPTQASYTAIRVPDWILAIFVAIPLLVFSLRKVIAIMRRRAGGRGFEVSSSGVPSNVAVGSGPSVQAPSPPSLSRHD